MNNRTQQKPMRTVWHSLLWKEWHEHKWKLVGLVAIMLSLPLIMSLNDPGSTFAAVSASLVGYAVIAAWFLGMNLAAGEKSGQTIRFLKALPAPLWKPAFVKMYVAMVVISIPVFLVTAVMFLWHSSWELLGVDYRVELTRLGWKASGGDWYYAHLALPLLAIISLLLWVAALGVKQQDEIRAGAFSLITIFAIWLLLGFAIDHSWVQKDPPLPKPLEALIAAAPAGPAAMEGYRMDARHDGFFSALTRGWLFWPTLAAIASHVWLAFHFLTKFGQTTQRVPRTNSEETRCHSVSQYLAPPRSSALRAILWKQMHETFPIASIGAAAIVLLSFVIAFGNYSSEVDDFFFQFNLFAQVTTSWMFIGFLVAIAAGIGVMGNDMQTGTHTFWRSRPINVDQWFWVKFLSGLSIVAAALVTPYLLLFGYWFLFSEGGQLIESCVSGYDSPIKWGWSFHLLAYAGAVVAMCLARKPLYAGIFAVAIWGFAMACATLLDFSPVDYGLVATFCSLLAAFAAVTAWLAVRNNWGWHR